MSPDEIKQLIVAGIEAQNSQIEYIEVAGDGSHFDVLIASDIFDGLRAVKRQQVIYGLLNDNIADGSLHAINMKTLTVAEYEEYKAEPK